MAPEQSTPQSHNVPTESDSSSRHSSHWLNKHEYNFEHFRFKHLVNDIQATRAEHGIQPGAEAPDFTLLRAGGGQLRLHDLRGKPVLLHFGSPT